MSKSIVPEILAKLEPYLEELDIKYEAQPKDKRFPTLPFTVDGKVNVRQITHALGLRESQEQHFYKKPELAAVVNSIARVQGLKQIGSRMLEESADNVVISKIAKISAEKNDFARTLAAKEAEIESLRAEIKALKAKIEFIETTGLLIR